MQEAGEAKDLEIDVLLRTTCLLFKEHLFRLLHSVPQAVPCPSGPVGHTANALAARARVVRRVKKCMIDGWLEVGAWGF